MSERRNHSSWQEPIERNGLNSRTVEPGSSTVTESISGGAYRALSDGFLKILFQRASVRDPAFASVHLHPWLRKPNQISVSF